jgi:hypothetical protein
MKTKLLILLTLLIHSISYSQNRTEVISDSSFRKDNLYSNALSFFAMQFKSANNVIQMKDPETGKVIGKGKAGDRNLTITISCKDGKYKYEIEIEDLQREVNLSINYLGTKAMGNDGITLAPVIFENGKPIILKDKIYFKYSNPQASNFKYYYDESISDHSPAWMTGGMYKKWKELVDIELETNKEKYNNLTKSDDLVLEQIIRSLKNQMSKSDW